MKIGLTLPTMVPGLTRDQLLSWVRQIDDGPFSSLAAGERITFPNQEIMVTMAAAAALTSRVRLAFTVVVLPMHPTALIAKQIATVDVISGGRVTLGVGTGGREEDFRAVGAPTAHKAARLADQVGVLRRLWPGVAALPDAGPVGPTPVQPGGPEILAGAVTPDGIRRAARWADGLCHFDFGPEPVMVEAAFEVARAAWSSAGRLRPPRLVTSCWYALGPKAREQMDAYVGRYMSIFGGAAASSSAAMCTTVSADALKEVVRAVADLGADELLLVPTTGDPDEVQRVADLVG